MTNSISAAKSEGPAAAREPPCVPYATTDTIGTELRVPLHAHQRSPPPAHASAPPGCGTLPNPSAAATPLPPSYQVGTPRPSPRTNRTRLVRAVQVGGAHAAQGREAAADVAAALVGAQRWLRTAPAAEIRAALPPRARDAWAPPPPPPPRARQKPGAPQRSPPPLSPYYCPYPCPYCTLPYRARTSWWLEGPPHGARGTTEGRPCAARTLRRRPSRRPSTGRAL
jgi:hypothetical protein